MKLQDRQDLNRCIHEEYVTTLHSIASRFNYDHSYRSNSYVSSEPADAGQMRIVL